MHRGSAAVVFVSVLSLCAGNASAVIIPIALPFAEARLANATADTIAALLRNASDVANAAEATGARLHPRPRGSTAAVTAWVDVSARLRILAFLGFPGAPGPAMRMALHAEVDDGVWADLKPATPSTRSSLRLAALAPSNRVPLSGVLSQRVLYADPAILPARCDAAGCRVGSGPHERGMTRAAAAGAVEQALRASMAAAAAAAPHGSDGRRGRGAHGFGKRRALSSSSAPGTRRFLLLRTAWNDTALVDTVDVGASVGAPLSTAGAAEGTAASAADLDLAARQLRDFLTNATGGSGFLPVVTAPSDCLYALGAGFAGSHGIDLFADVANPLGLLWSAVASHAQPACRVPADYDYLLCFHPKDARRPYGGVASVGQPWSFYNGPWATVGWWGATHELGHSLGLRHAFALVDGEPTEYAGGSDVMGAGRTTPVAPSLGLMYSAAEKHAMHLLPPGTLLDADAAWAAGGARRAARTTLLGIERPDFVAAAASSGGHVGVRWPRSPPGGAAAPWTSRWVYATWRSLLFAPNATPALPVGGAGVHLHYQSYEYDEMGYDGLVSAFHATPPGRTLGWASPPLHIDSTPFSRWLLDAAVPLNSAFIDGQGTGTPVLVRVSEGPAVPGSGLGASGDRTLGVEVAALNPRTLERSEGRGCWLRGGGDGSPGCQPALADIPTLACVVGGTARAELSVNRSARSLVVVLALPRDASGPLAFTATSCASSAASALAVYSSPPAAQLLHGAALPQGATGYSDATVTGALPGGPADASVSACGTLQAALTANGSLFVVVSLPGAAWAAGASGGLLRLSVNCSMAEPLLPRSVIVQTSPLPPDPAVGVAQGVPNIWEQDPVSPVRFGRRSFISEAFSLGLNAQLSHNGLRWGNWGVSQYALGADCGSVFYYTACQPSSNSWSSLTLSDDPVVLATAADVTSLNSSQVLVVRYVCARGLYANASSDRRGTTCSACPANSVAPQGAEGIASCLCAPGFTRNGSACIACPSETYKPSRGNGPCAVCPTGTSTATTAPAGGATSYFQCEFPVCAALNISGFGSSPWRYRNTSANPSPAYLPYPLNGLYELDGGERGFPRYTRRSDGLALIRSVLVANAWEFWFNGSVYDPTNPASPPLVWSSYVASEYASTALWPILHGALPQNASAVWTGTYPPPFFSPDSDHPVVACSATPSLLPTCNASSIRSPGSAGGCVLCPQYRLADDAHETCLCPPAYANPAGEGCTPPVSLLLSVATDGSYAGELRGIFQDTQWMLEAATRMAGSPVYAFPFPRAASGVVLLYFDELHLQWSLAFDAGYSGARLAVMDANCTGNTSAAILPALGVPAIWRVWSADSLDFSDTVSLSFDLVTLSVTQSRSQAQTASPTPSASKSESSTYSQATSYTGTGSGTQAQSVMPTPSSSGSQDGTQSASRTPSASKSESSTYSQATSYTGTGSGTQAQSVMPTPSSSGSHDGTQTTSQAPSPTQASMTQAMHASTRTPTCTPSQAPTPLWSTSASSSPSHTSSASLSLSYVSNGGLSASETMRPSDTQSWSSVPSPSMSLSNAAMSLTQSHSPTYSFGESASIHSAIASPSDDTAVESNLASPSSRPPSTLDSSSSAGFATSTTLSDGAIAGVVVAAAVFVALVAVLVSKCSHCWGCRLEKHMVLPAHSRKPDVPEAAVVPCEMSTVTMVSVATNNATTD